MMWTGYKSFWYDLNYSMICFEFLHFQDNYSSFSLICLEISHFQD